MRTWNKKRSVGGKFCRRAASLKKLTKNKKVLKYRCILSHINDILCYCRMIKIYPLDYTFFTVHKERAVGFEQTCYIFRGPQLKTSSVSLWEPVRHCFWIQYEVRHALS